MRDAVMLALGVGITWLCLHDHYQPRIADLETELRAAEDDLRIAQGGPGIPWRQAAVFRTNRVPRLAPRRPTIAVLPRPARVLPPLADVAPFPDPPRRWLIPISTDELEALVS